MRLRSVILLLAAVAIGLTAYFYTSNNKFKSVLTSVDLIPSLQGNLNSVTKFTVLEAGNLLLSSVSKTESGWIVDNRDGYEANVAAVRNVFENLAEAKLAEAKTSNPQNYTKLGVESIENENAQGVLLTVDGLGDTVNIIFGNDGSSGKNTQYVRHQKEQQSWLINKKINIARDPTDWLEKDILDIPPERIKNITIQHADGTVIDINNTGNQAYEFVIDAIAPDGMKISDSQIYQVANALSSLQLTDVSKAELLRADDLAPSVTTVFKTFDGLTITTRAYPGPVVKLNFMIDIDFNAAHVDENIENKTPEAESTIDAAMISDPKAAESLSKSLKQKLDGWAYVLPTISQAALTKKLTDFFIDKDA
ncbi:MAG: DUF4340 domain-containing protein [Pseudomonadota bacterium]